jgi:hypothetical protein
LIRVYPMKFFASGNAVVGLTITPIPGCAPGALSGRSKLPPAGTT